MNRKKPIVSAPPEYAGWPTPAKQDTSNEKTIADVAQLTGLRNLKPYLGTIEAAVQEYARNSRDVEEGVDARRALVAIRELVQVTR